MDHSTMCSLDLGTDKHGDPFFCNRPRSKRSDALCDEHHAESLGCCAEKGLDESGEPIYCGERSTHSFADFEPHLLVFCDKHGAEVSGLRLRN